MDENKVKWLLQHLHSYDEMVARNKRLSYPSGSVKELLNELDKVYG